MRRLALTTLLLFIAMTALNVYAQEPIRLTSTDLNNIYKTTNRSWVSIHDPSVVHASGSTFYIIGSHRGWGRSTDNMVNLQGLDNGSLFGTVNASGSVVVTNYANAFKKNQVTKVKALINGEVKEVDFGNYDAEAWAHADDAGYNISGNMWAPDLLYNPNSKKWMMYMSINGDAWHSVIVLLTADRITGPYVYQGPVHFSGFRNTTTPQISWKKTDLELVIGQQSTLPARYNRGNDWGTYWTNDIDPCVFFDEEGELWMTYGSWSGGIFILKMDKETGLRDYTYTYALKNDNNGRALTDPYFGKRIAGGYYSSGEGSYVQKIGDYYYLFMSYGGFAPDGGYEMRTFRSRTPDGQYVDANNLDACYHDRYWLNYGTKAQTNGGMKLMGAYNNWGFMTIGECAQGHNSATADDKGRNFVVYHTKFNDGTAGHQVRVHQLFLNHDGWLCAAPFQFDGETENDDSIAKRCLYTKAEIAGTYDVLIHKYRMDHENMEEVKPIHLTLTDAGKVTGDLTGSWSLTEGTGYVKITAGSVTYNGVIIQQQVDGTTLKAVCFTATAKSGVSIWGWKMEPQSAIAYTFKNYTMPVKAGTSINKNTLLGGTGYYGATIEWESSEPDVISPTGKYNPREENIPLTLTCRISCGNYVYEQAFDVTAQRATDVIGDPLSGIMAYYNFDERPTTNAYNSEEAVTYTRISTGTIPTLEEDPSRFGQVVHVYGNEARKNSYTRMPNPLQGQTDLTGFTVAAWIKRADIKDLTGTLWAFTEKQGNLTTNTDYLGLAGCGEVDFNAGVDNFVMNAATSSAKSILSANTWELVTITVSAEDGVTLYVGGTKKTLLSFTSTAGTGTNATRSMALFDFKKVMGFITTAGYFQLGIGTGNGSADACFDDLLIYNRALTANDVRGLNTLMNRVTDFSPEATGIEDINVNGHSYANDGIYDLSGRRVTSLVKKGIYIIGGKKVIIK